jgi:hypothetical protein
VPSHDCLHRCYRRAAGPLKQLLKAAPAQPLPSRASGLLGAGTPRTRAAGQLAQQVLHGHLHAPQQKARAGLAQLAAG